MTRPATLEFAAAGVRWTAVAEVRDRLFGAAGLRLAEWRRQGLAHVVKHGPHRIVYRVELPGLPCYVKHNLLPNLRARLRESIRPSKARVEFQKALAVAARGVPTVAPLAVGERSPAVGGESFLVTRSLEDTVSLTHFLEAALPTFPPSRRARLRLRLAVELGRFIARLHDAGVTHRDLHTGNLLLRLEGNGRPALYLIDLQPVRLGRPLRGAAARANLVMLNRWFAVRAHRADRLRFWRAYCAAREGGPPEGADVLALALERATARSNEWFWRRRDVRCRKSNRYYRRVRSAVAAGHAVRDLDPGLLASLLADPDGPFHHPTYPLLKDSRSSTVAELDAPVNGRPGRLIYKRFRVTKRTDAWANRVRRSPALRSWLFGHSLRERGLPTPRPLLVLHRRRHGLPAEGYLLTEKVPAAIDLHSLLSRLRPDSPTGRAELRRRIDELARLIRELHRRFLSHRDLKAANVLFQERGEGRGARDEERLSVSSLAPRPSPLIPRPFPCLPAPPYAARSG